MSDLRESAARGLEDARRRTRLLTDVDEVELTTQHSPLMSPLVWDLAHIGQQEDLWLLRGGDAARQGLLSAKVESLYDAFEHPRAGRVALPLLTPGEARSYLADVRGRVLDGLERAADRADGLFPYAMVEQHEQQHVETMLATHQLRVGEPVLGPGAPVPPGRVLPPDDAVVVPGGTVRARCRRRRPARRARLARQRAARARRRPARLPHRAGAGHQRAVAAVPRGRRLRRAPLVERARLAAPHRRGAGAAAVLVRRRLAAPVRRRRGGAARRAGAARVLLRGRGLRRLGRRPATHRGGVGEGVRLGSRARPAAPLAVGRQRVDAGPGQPRWRRAAPGPGGRLPGRRLAVRRRADDR